MLPSTSVRPGCSPGKCSRRPVAKFSMTSTSSPRASNNSVTATPPGRPLRLPIFSYVCFHASSYLRDSQPHGREKFAATAQAQQCQVCGRTTRRFKIFQNCVRVDKCPVALAQSFKNIPRKILQLAAKPFLERHRKPICPGDSKCRQAAHRCKRSSTSVSVTAGEFHPPAPWPCSTSG